MLRPIGKCVALNVGQSSFSLQLRDLVTVLTLVSQVLSSKEGYPPPNIRQNLKEQEERTNQRAEDGEECCEILSLEHNTTTVTMNALQLQLPIRDQVNKMGQHGSGNSNHSVRY